MVVCTVLTVVCVAGTLWALHRRHRRQEAQRRRAARQRRREKGASCSSEWCDARQAGTCVLLPHLRLLLLLLPLLMHWLLV